MFEFALPAAIIFIVFGLFAVVMALVNRRPDNRHPDETRYHTIQR